MPRDRVEEAQEDSKKRRLKEADVAVGETTAKVGILFGQLDTLVSELEQSIAGRGVSSKPGPKSANLEKELEELENWGAAIRAEAQRETKKSLDWEFKAILATREGRRDLADQANRRAASHRHLSATLHDEVEALSKCLDEVRQALTGARNSP